jgi:ferric-dicitrate binding protein FerR (iron transport regulator)
MNHRLRFLVRQAAAAMFDTWHDPDKGWEKVRNKRAYRRLRSLRLRALKYVAALILVTGTVAYLHLYHSDKFTDMGSSQRTPSRVTLILANGEQIKWEDDKQQFHIEDLGISITRDSAGSIMQYQADGIAEEHAKHNQLIVPRGCEFSAQLPDGSIVWLNSATSLRFPVKFSHDERTVHLEGEAYFEVVPNEEMPFRVISGDKTITVLGTRFNVSAYSDDPTWHVTLVDGKVSVRLGEEKERILKPSQQLLFHGNSGKDEINNVEIETYTAWTRGQIYFKLSPLEEIVKKLERWYDFTITYEEEQLRQVQFRGGINKYRPLEETLRYLEETGKVRFTIQGENVIVTRAIEKG